MIVGIFFDLGGTLFAYHEANRELGSRLVDSLRSLPGASALPAREIGHAYRRANDAVVQRFAKLDYYLHADMFRESYEQAATLIGAQFDEAIYEAYRQYQHTTIVEGMPIKPDCHATLSALKQRGLYLSIGSNIDEDMLQPMVQRELLHELLDDWTSSEAARYCKPHAKFFETALDKSGLTADQVLFVGDSPEHDINGAQAVGMRTVLVKNPGGQAPLQSGIATQDPDYVVESLSELVAITDSINQSSS